MPRSPVVLSLLLLALLASLPSPVDAPRLASTVGALVAPLTGAGPAFGAPDPRAGLAGTWIHRDATTGITIAFRLTSDGTGSLGDEAFTYSVDGDRLVLTIDGESMAYEFRLEGDTLVLSGGDLEAPTAFTRSDGSASAGGGGDAAVDTDESGADSEPGSGAPSDPPAGTAPGASPGAADARLVGKWHASNGSVIELRADGTGVNGRGPFRWVASEGMLLYDDGAAQVLLAYRLEAGTLTVESHGETATFTRAAPGGGAEGAGAGTPGAGSAAGAKSAGTKAAAPKPGPDGTPAGRNVTVNRKKLGAAEIEKLERGFQVRILDGAYWYDAASGAWGIEKGPTMGFLPARLALGGPLPADASGGGTGVFVNGRELHPLDVAALQRITIVQPGRYWVDERGNCGYEGNPTPILNLVQLSNAANARSGGSYHSRSDITGIGSGGDGKTSYVMGKDWSVIIGE